MLDPFVAVEHERPVGLDAAPSRGCACAESPAGGSPRTRKTGSRAAAAIASVSSVDLRVDADHDLVDTAATESIACSSVGASFATVMQSVSVGRRRPAPARSRSAVAERRRRRGSPGTQHECRRPADRWLAAIARSSRESNSDQIALRYELFVLPRSVHEHHERHSQWRRPPRCLAGRPLLGDDDVRREARQPPRDQCASDVAHTSSPRRAQRPRARASPCRCRPCRRDRTSGRGLSSQRTQLQNVPPGTRSPVGSVPSRKLRVDGARLVVDVRNEIALDLDLQAAALQDAEQIPVRHDARAGAGHRRGARRIDRDFRRLRSRAGGGSMRQS